MRKIFSIAAIVLVSMNMYAQTLQDAQREIDNENYFKAKQMLFKLLNDGTSSKADVSYYLGNTYLKTEDADSAKIFYKLVWNPDTKTPLGYLANGRLALLAKNPTEAKVNFDRATQITKSKNANIFYEIGEAYSSSFVKNYTTAITFYEQAYTLDNKSVGILLGLGDAYLANSANDNTMGGKAMTKYESASDLTKTNPLVWIKIGRLSAAGRIYDQAIESFNKALVIDQKYPIVYKELAEAYFFTKQYDKFKTNFEKYIELSPGDNQAKASIINLYFQSKEYDKVLDEATKGLVNDPQNFEFQRGLMYANFELKRYAEASNASKAFWANPLKKLKDDDFVYSARIAAQVGDTAAAFNFFKTALANDSANCSLQGEYGKALYLAKLYTDAIAQFAKKQVCEKFTSLDLFYLGKSYYGNGDYLRADSTFAEFVTRNPTSPDGYAQRASANLKMGKAEDYLSYPFYLKFIELTASEPAKYKRNLTDAYSYVGLYYFDKLKNKDEAKSYFLKALEVDPANSIAIEFMKQYN